MAPFFSLFYALNAGIFSDASCSLTVCSSALMIGISGKIEGVKTYVIAQSSLSTYNNSLICTSIAYAQDYYTLAECKPICKPLTPPSGSRLNRWKKDGVWIWHKMRADKETWPLSNRQFKIVVGLLHPYTLIVNNRCSFSSNLKSLYVCLQRVGEWGVTPTVSILKWLSRLQRLLLVQMLG
jgi:hypothetical protein